MDVASSMRVGFGWLVPSLHRAGVWFFFSLHGHESEVKVVNNKAIWKDYKLHHNTRRLVEDAITGKPGAGTFRSTRPGEKVSSQTD